MEALEDRRLLANLNFVATGAVIYGGGGGDNDLQISVAGDIYTYTDPNETITLLGSNVPATNTGSGTNTVTFDASTTVTPLSLLVINTNGGTDTVSVSGIRAGGEGLEIRDSNAADTVNITGDIGAVANPVQSFGVTIAASQLNLGANIYTNNLNIILGAALSETPIALATNSEIDAGTGTVTLNAGNAGLGVSGAGTNLTVNGGSVQLRGDVLLTGASDISLNATGLLQVGTSGENTELSSGTGEIALDGGTKTILTDSVSTGGSANVAIMSPTTLMRSAAGKIEATGGSISIFGALSSATAVDVDASGSVVLTGTVALAGLSVNSGGASSINHFINVTGNFEWRACNGGGNTLLVLAQITVDGNSTLQADTLNVQVAPSVTGTDMQLFTC